MIQSLDSDYVTAAEACELLGVKLNTLYAYASRGRLRSYRLGMKRRRYYSRRELQKLAGFLPASTEAFRVVLPKAEDWVGSK